jgi:hypothetical protein
MSRREAASGALPPMAGRRTPGPCAASPLLESRELRPRKTLQETSRRRWSWSW